MNRKRKTEVCKFCHVLCTHRFVQKNGLVDKTSSNWLTSLFHFDRFVILGEVQVTSHSTMGAGESKPGICLLLFTLTTCIFIMLSQMPNLVKVTVNEIWSNFLKHFCFSLFGQRKQLSLICSPPLPKKKVFKRPPDKEKSDRCLGKAFSTGKISETYRNLNKIYYNIL